MRAFGGTSGVIEGEIRALFFRYKSLGGQEHTTDLVIGPGTDAAQHGPAPPFTKPGDSGTLWFYDPPLSGPAAAQPDSPQLAATERWKRARRLRPIAMQWGAERYVSEDGTHNALALASFLSTICRALAVDIVPGARAVGQQERQVGNSSRARGQRTPIGRPLDVGLEGRHGQLDP